MVTATIDIVLCYCDVLEFILVTATEVIVQCYCVVFGVNCGHNNSRCSAMVLCCVRVYCGYTNSRYSAIFLCCVCNLLWLRQQKIQCNGNVFFPEIIVVTSTVDIVQCYCVVLEYI